MAFLFKQPGSKYWYAGWKDEHGKRVNRSTRVENKQGNRKRAQKVADGYEETAKNMKAARRVRETIADLHMQITGQELPTATVAQYCDQFLEMKKGESSKATQYHYQTIFNNFKDWLGDRANEDLNTIRQSDIAAFRNHLLTSVSEVTANKKMKGIRAMFKSAHNEGLVLEEPTAALKLTRKRGSTRNELEKRPFTLDELKLVLNEAHDEWQSMVMFGLYTGQRLGDLATLRWSNLDLQNEEVRLTTRKSNRRIVIPMAAPLLKHVMNLEPSTEPTGYIHPELAAQYEKSGSATLSNQFNSILARCGLREPVSHKSQDKGRDVARAKTVVSFHCLRATAVTLLHDAGIPAATVEEWVGHDSAEVHKAYVKIGKESLQKASKALPDIS
ncbi:tyrosine recombinase XerC [Rubritalea halochordaticola]|uniref:Tyrosine recombinase XerC n=1 Tax=Rubritalea halochordaticola TaxID=714537 RepID=A0ABP9V5Z6_9BACT